MKIKIVQFENGCYGVQMKSWLDENAHWLYSNGLVYRSWRPSVERCFDTIDDAERAIEKYKQHQRVYHDEGKLVKKVKL